MNITIKQVKCFVAVAKSRSFADACNFMHLSQPALSIAIRNLEESLGGKLLARTTRTVTLTPEGEVFYKLAKQLLSDWESSLDEVCSLFTLKRGRLNIAAMPTFAGTLLPSLLSEFQHSYPDINITVHDIVAERVVDEVLNGRIELGITFEPGYIDGIDFQPLFLDDFVAVFPPDHPLIKKKRVKLKDLEGNSYITLQRPSTIRELVIDNLNRHGVMLAPTFEAHQLSVVGRMVSEGLGISIVPEISALQMKEMGAQCKPLTPKISRKIGYVTHQRRPLSSVTLAMLEILKGYGNRRSANQ
jgi:LysR family transcriptional regulator, carnitine catabolism transcriptional activator